MPNNTTSIIAAKPLNTFLSGVPNCYFKLTEGAIDTAVTEVVDQNTNNDWALTLETAGAGNWSGDRFAPAATNTQYTMSLLASENPTLFGQIFNGLNTGSWLCYVDIEHVVDNAAGKRIMSINNVESGNDYRSYDLRANPNGTANENPILAYANDDVCSRAFALNQTHGRQIYILHVDKRASGTNQTVSYHMTPGSKAFGTDISPSNFDVSAVTFPDVDLAQAKLMVGAYEIASGGIQSRLEGVSIRDLRFINFGNNQPSDLTEFIEDLALHSSAGSRRDY